MTAKIDDLEAVRILAETLQSFASDDRERIIRWAREKLGMTTSAASALGSRVETTSDAPRDAVLTGSQGAVDIKKFVTEKAPKSDVQFAATVAYFYPTVLAFSRFSISGGSPTRSITTTTDDHGWRPASCMAALAARATTMGIPDADTAP